ncbi:MAG TPA: SDR family NAD(P)-dependent oxidoreductase [Methylomirabilota bacterium]|jgi:3-oxoacyl-[acyl-carrier protein] reductase|nr:SDR family NAD(P)-dependent oxidoreductase [Methylomirabilota bacterium]
MDLQGRGAFVTGGSGDLGTAICVALARAGCDIALGYVGNVDGARRTTKRVEELGRRACAIQLDQTDPSRVDSAVDEAARALGRLDVLVNNAAWNIGVPFPELDKITTEVWDRTFNTNVRGPFQLARAAAVHMKRSGGGRIVNIASVAGLRPTGSSIAYGASKAALIHLTRGLAVALAPSITVNCVAPGLIEGTRMAQRLPQAVVDNARASVVLGRSSSMEDIAEQVVTFCRADSVTGQLLVIDGGAHFH